MEGRSYGTSIDVRNVGHLRAARRYGAAIIYPQQYHRPFPLPLPSSRLVRAERSREGRGAHIPLIISVKRDPFTGRVRTTATNLDETIYKNAIRRSREAEEDSLCSSREN